MAKKALVNKAKKKPQIVVEDVESAMDRALVRYDKTGDQHYDVISAFIKSMRGSESFSRRSWSIRSTG